jgi:hypothetical protein
MGAIRPEFGALFGPKKSIRAGENLFAWDLALLRISPVPFVRYADAQNLVTSKIRRSFGVRISPSWAGSQQLNFVSFDLHEAVSASASAAMFGRGGW